MGIRTPLARVRGLGSAKDGTHHWWMQRVTAIALIPLGIWFVYALLHFSMSSLTAVREWLESPVQTMLLGAFLFVSIYHAKLGMQVVIEDYVHANGPKYTLLLLNTFGFALLFLMALMSLFTLHFM